ncbi:hypothetical protein CRYUN_Cryun10bG0172600 [Craigia yunnanensis]
MGSVFRIPSPFFSNFPPLLKCTEKALHSFHSWNLKLVHIHRPHARLKQPSFFVGQLLSACIHLRPPPIISTSIQSHSIRNYREAKYHFHEPQLRHPFDDELNPPSPRVQP